MWKNQKYTQLEDDWYLHTYESVDQEFCTGIMNGARHKHDLPDGGVKYFCYNHLNGKCYHCGAQVPATVTGFVELVRWKR